MPSYSPTVLAECSCCPVLTFITDAYTLNTSGVIVTATVGTTIYTCPAKITLACIVRCTHTIAMDTFVVTSVHQIKMYHYMKQKLEKRTICRVLVREHLGRLRSNWQYYIITNNLWEHQLQRSSAPKIILKQLQRKRLGM
jgi:hypothetical protein